MSNLDRNLTILIYMKKYCEQVDEAFRVFEKNLDKFINNNVFRNAVSMPIFQIGELVNHLTQEYLTETQNEINWNIIRGMRNRFAHGYCDMDYEIIYDTAIKDIPKINNFINKEIERLGKNSLLGSEKNNEEEEI